MLTSTRVALPFIALTLIAACASSPPLQVDLHHGARRGEIVALYDMTAGAAAMPACLARLPAAEISSHRFVRVRYRHVRHLRYDVAELSAGSALQVGDEVEFWPADCDAGRLARIGKELPTMAHTASPPAREATGMPP